MVDGGARTPLSPAVQRTVAAIVIRLASRAQYSKVCGWHAVLLVSHFQRPYVRLQLCQCCA